MLSGSGPGDCGRALRILSEQDRNDALLARSDNDRAKRSLPNSEPDFLIGTAAGVLRRRRALHVRRLFVEASAGIEACVVCRLRDRVAGGKSSTNHLRPVADGIVLRRQPSGGIEYAMKIARATTDRVCQFSKRWRFFPRLNNPARLRDQGRVLGFDRSSVWLAPPAGAEPIRLCTF
jgi:hypothetical protein